MGKKKNFCLHSEIYSPSDIDRVLSMAVDETCLRGNNKKQKFFNVPCSFDIETTSFYRDGDKCYDYEQYSRLGGKLEKCSCMYVWQFGINGYVIVGRTWDEFTEMMAKVSETLGLKEDRRLIVFVHNLSYEFQFIRKRFTWNKVFSIDLRKPIYAITDSGIEFRCSYLLSGYSLAKLGDQLTKYKCAKMVGDLDYSLMRHSGTPLTDKEYGYIVNDVNVVMCYSQEMIERYRGITGLPITKTGFVRKYCRKQCLYTKDENGKTVNNWDFVNTIHSLNISGTDEFNTLQRAFSGGFTHANMNYTDDIVENVSSYDFTSSYPYVMVSEKFPMSSGVKVTVKSRKHFDFLISKYCCVFDIELTKLISSQAQDTPLSVSKCFYKEKVVENNGRVFSADKVITTITDVDYGVLKMFYRWDSEKVVDMWCYRKEYLPTEFVRSILGLYANKTTLKGVVGKEVEYLNSKEMLNSCYGMCVTNPLRDEFTYEGEWDVSTLSPEKVFETLQKYNESRNRFLFYPWGVFVTAYARRNLFTGIYERGDDYVYSDTDSVKVRHADRHQEYFKQYNNLVQYKLRQACKHHGLPFEMVEPKTIKGVNKILGVWDYEGTYTRFKTLGAKRYMVEEEDALRTGGKSYPVSLTVSGVNKKTAIPYLLEKYGQEGIFEAFTNYLAIPPQATGKNIHTYIDYEQSGEFSDYTGETGGFSEMTGVHLEPTGYSLSLSVMYLNFLMGIRLKD